MSVVAWSLRTFAPLLLIVPFLCACSAVVSNLTNNLADDLSSAVLRGADSRVVADGLPAYLLLVDALIEGNPNDASLLNTASMLNAAYATAFVVDESRQKHFSSKAKDLALRASCSYRKSFCTLLDASYDDFTKVIGKTIKADVEYLYTLATSWAGWIQANTDDFSAIVELPKAQNIFERIIELDETHADGSPFIYMGVFATFLPAALGGQPEVGRANFERAIVISDETNLYAKVMMAEMYARGMFNRELHDRLVDEVLAADPVAGDLTLQNVIAQAIAKQLKESADEFF